MADNIGGANANISKIQLKEQGSDPATPPSGFAYAYAKTGGGLYLKNDGGNVLGPFGPALDLVTGTSTALDGATALVLGSGLSFSVTGTVGFINVDDTGWLNYSGSSTVVGWSAFTEKNIFYRRVNGVVFVKYRIAGTSDATTATATLPILSFNDTDLLESCFVVDASVASPATGRCLLPALSATITFGKAISASGGFTGTGTKVVQGEFFYMAA